MKKPIFKQRHATRESFSFPSQGLFVAIYALIVGSMIVLNMVTGYRSGWKSGLHGFLAFAPFWLFAAAFALPGRCSIVIDDKAITKRLFGYTWERIGWNELGCARLRSVRTRSGTLTVFLLERKFFAAPTRKNRLWFTNEVEMLDRLLGKINSELAANTVPVYDERTGKHIELKQLPLSLKSIEPHSSERGSRTRASSTRDNVP